MSLKKNVVANYLGQAWRALMALAFVPVYIQLLGIEAYGLIGTFAILQSWLGLLDMGMKPALGREMARFTGGLHETKYIRDLLRSIEAIAVLIAGVIALGVWAASGWLAADWLRPARLSVEIVAQAIAIMGAVTALRFIEQIYASAIAGLQRQVLLNVVASAMATVRAIGAVAVLVWVSPTISAFFIWQGLVSIVTLVFFAIVTHASLPASPTRANFSWPALSSIWRFSAGMLTITLLSLLLTQVDKILLSRLLSLTAFGYYALAGVVANSLYMLAAPVTTAFYPRFTELVTRGDDKGLRTVYHQAAQIVTVLMGAAAIVLLTLSEIVLVVWTGDRLLSREVAPVLSVLALGTLLHGLMWIPYQMQLAFGWTTLAIRINVVAVIVLIPIILFTVPRFGAIGAAWSWVALNTGYLVFTIYYMHRRLLPTEKWVWYREDIFLPLAAAGIVGLICRFFFPAELGRTAAVGFLVASSVLVLAAAAAAAPSLRNRLRQ